MILQPNSKLKCQKDNHLDEIDTVCYNQFCTEFRLICFRCLKYGRIHHDHFKDVEKISTLITNIEDKNQECDNFIEELSKYVESVNQTLSSFKMGIRSKCSFQKEQLVNLNSQLINDYLNSSFQLIEKNNQQQQSFQNRLKNQMIYLIIYMENYTYTSFTITKLKYLLQDIDENSKILSKELFYLRQLHYINPYAMSQICKLNSLWSINNNSMKILRIDYMKNELNYLYSIGKNKNYIFILCFDQSEDTLVQCPNDIIIIILIKIINQNFSLDLQLISLLD